MVSEQKAINQWRELFGSADLTKSKLKAGQAVVEDLPYDSPLRTRFNQELTELQEILKKKGK